MKNLVTMYLSIKCLIKKQINFKNKFKNKQSYP